MNQHIPYYPFHAINDFMRDDYRSQVIKEVSEGLSGLTDDLRSPVLRLIRQQVKVPGFRDASKAPSSLRLKPTAEAFQKNPHLVAAILQTWSAVHSDLREQVHTFLSQRNWEILPAKADRRKLPGFLIEWPAGESFDGMFDAFKEIYPDEKTSKDDFSLMVVWVSNRLPYQKDEVQEAES